MSNTIASAINQYSITDTHLRVHQDQYDLNKIFRAQVKELNWRNHLLKIILSGLLISSILFLFVPASLPFAQWLPVVGFTAGAIATLSACHRYELRVEFMHIDETGLQWVTVDSGRNVDDLERFKKMAREINQTVD
jgi:hypothetical protein